MISVIRILGMLLIQTAKFLRIAGLLFVVVKRGALVRA
jgi:hypothetical protein